MRPPRRGCATTPLSEDLRQLVTGASAVIRSVDESADTVIALKRALQEAEELARRHGFDVTGLGVVLDIDPPAPDVPDYAAIQEERAVVRAEVIDRL